MSGRFLIAGTTFFFGLGIYFIASVHRETVAVVLPF